MVCSVVGLREGLQEGDPLADLEVGNQGQGGRA